MKMKVIKLCWASNETLMNATLMVFEILVRMPSIRLAIEFVKPIFWVKVVTSVL